MKNFKRTICYAIIATSFAMPAISGPMVINPMSRCDGPHQTALQNIEKTYAECMKKGSPLNSGCSRQKDWSTRHANENYRQCRAISGLNQKRFPF